MVINLVVLKGGASQKAVTLPRPRTVCGRKKGCKIRIPSSLVSRVHCVLIQQNNTLYVKDLGSSNGTFVNGARITVRELKAGEVLDIGPVSFLVQIDGIPAVSGKPAKPVEEPQFVMEEEEDVVFFDSKHPHANEGRRETGVTHEVASAEDAANFITADDSESPEDPANLFGPEDSQAADDAAAFLIDDDHPAEGPSTYGVADDQEPHSKKRRN